MTHHRSGAMILAAGKGTRMGSISDRVPKALTPVRGKTLLQRALDRCLAAGLGPVVLNTHHLADQVVDHVRTRYDADAVIFSEEECLLETGGGVKKALPFLRQDAFAVLNVDVIHDDPSGAFLARLLACFDRSKMDCLMTVVEDGPNTSGWLNSGDMVPHGPVGLDPVSLCLKQGQTAPLFYTGTMVVHPDLYQDTPSGAFSNRLIFERAERAGRLFGLRFSGTCCHVGTPKGREEAEARI